MMVWPGRQEARGPTGRGWTVAELEEAAHELEAQLLEDLEYIADRLRRYNVAYPPLLSCTRAASHVLSTSRSNLERVHEKLVEQLQAARQSVIGPDEESTRMRSHLLRR